MFRTFPSASARVAYPWGMAVLLGAAGFLINLWPVPLSPGTNLVFGGVAYLLAAAAFGPGPGLLAGAIASVRTLWLWQHPYAWLIASLEAATVGLVVRRWGFRPIVADMIFWLVLGLPTLFLTYHLILGVSGPTALVLFLKQPFNGLVAALLAEGLLLVPPVRRAMRKPQAPQLRSAIAVVVTLAAVLPTLVFGVWMGRQEWQRNIQRAQERMILFAQAHASKLEQYVLLHERSIRTIAHSAERRQRFNPEQLQRLVDVGNEQYPGFLDIYAADAAGIAVAFHPLTGPNGQSRVGLDFSKRAYYHELRRTREPLISNMFATRDGRMEPLIIIGEPIVLADTFAGYALGALDPKAFPQPTPAPGPDERLRIADSRGTLIFDSQPPDHTEQTPRQVSNSIAFGAVRRVQDYGIIFYQYQGEDQVAAQALAGVAYISSLGWWVWVEQRLAAVQEFVTDSYVWLFALLIAVTLIALIVSDRLAGLVVAPLLRIRAATAALTAGDAGEQIGALSAVVPTEIQELGRSFDEMSTALVARTEELEELGDITRSLALTLDPDELLRRVIDAAVRLVESEGCGIALLNENRTVLTAADYSVGLLAPLGKRTIPLEGSLIGWVARNQESVMLEDAATDPRIVPSVVDTTRIASIISAPLVGRSGSLGTLTVVRSRSNPRPFRLSELHLMERLARTAALAVENARLFEAAQAASRAKSDFIATISHELRTPLNAVLGHLDLLLLGVHGEMQPKQRDALVRIASASRHLRSLIDEVLSLARLEAGHAEVVREATNIYALVEEVTAVIQPLAAEKALRFEVVPREPMEPLMTDPGKVRQILINLAGNAVKFTDRGEVRIRIESRDTGVEIAVEDTGPGIPAAGLARLFRAFEQLESGFARPHGGTGLGLYLSGRYAQLLGGRIEVKSEVGRGSTFTLVLPREP